MSDVKTVTKSVEQKFADRGIRLTRRRRQVLDVLMSADAALSAYDIAELCNAGSESHMPTMSVSRILDLLQEEQFIHRLETANKYVSCYHIACAHEHSGSQFLICDGCRRVEEIQLSPEAVGAVEMAANAVGFASISPQLEVKGLCVDCQPERI